MGDRTAEKYKILIADDQWVVLDGIQAVFEDETAVEIVGTAKNGAEVIGFLDQTEVDVVIMDINMPNVDGMRATETIKVKYPTVKILMNSVSDDSRFIKKALKLGVDGYILKDSRKAEFLKAIQALREGNEYYDDRVKDKVIEFWKRKNDREITESGGGELSKRELEVLKLIVKECSTEEIADQLSISKATVNAHRRNLYQKTGAKNIVGLIKYALHLGLIEDF